MIVELCRNMRYNEGKNSGLCGYLKKERKMLNFFGQSPIYWTADDV